MPQQAKASSPEAEAWYYEEPTYIDLFVSVSGCTRRFKITRRQLNASLQRMNARIR